jgi:hypothetical protein
MSAKEQAIQSLEHAKSAIKDSIHLSEEQKKELHKNIEYSMSNIPEGGCSSPEVVLAVSIMREAYLDTVKALMSSLPNNG